jgi:hypothetical protein
MPFDHFAFWSRDLRCSLADLEVWRRSERDMVEREGLDRDRVVVVMVEMAVVCSSQR